MSQPLSSSNRLTYSRDFLLQYQHIYKPDPTIADMVTPYVVSPRSTPLKNSFASKLMDSPHQRKKLTNEQKPRESNFPSSFKTRTMGQSQSSTTGHNENSETVPSRWSNLQSLSAGPSPFKTHKGPVPRLTLPSTSPASPRTVPNPPPPSSPERNNSIIPGSPIPHGSHTSRATSSDSLGTSPSRIRSTSDPASSLTPPADQTSPQKTSPQKMTETPSSSKKQMVTPFRSNKTTPRVGHPGSPLSGRSVTPVDDQRLVQRQKQIDYGYRTVGYVNYRIMVQKERRKPEHPRTPKRSQNCSKRSWDGQLKKWRRDLHFWDPNNLEAFKTKLNTEMAIIIALNPDLTDIVQSVYQKLEDPSLLLEDEESDTDDTDSPTTPRTARVTPSVPQKSTEPRLEKVARTLIF
jgi:hypothetical protein